MVSGAKSYMRKGFLIYEEMRIYLTIYEEALSHTYIYDFAPDPSECPYCEENFNIFFISG